MTSSLKPQSAGVHFPPPFLFLIGLGVAWLLETRVLRFHLVSEAAGGHAFDIAGVAFLIAGFSLMLWGFSTFLAARTAIIPFKPATKIVQHGPYRFTRNPMYTGMATAYFGGTLIMNSGWALILLPIVMLALYHIVIRKEENYLSSAFPEDYPGYRARVRRWL